MSDLKQTLISTAVPADPGKAIEPMGYRDPYWVREPKRTWFNTGNPTYSQPSNPGWNSYTWSNWGNAVDYPPGNNVSKQLQLGIGGGYDNGQWWTRGLCFGPYYDLSGNVPLRARFSFYFDFNGVPASDVNLPAVLIDVSHDSGVVIQAKEYTAAQLGAHGLVDVNDDRSTIVIPRSAQGYRKLETRFFHRNGIGKVWFSYVVVDET